MSNICITSVNIKIHRLSVAISQFVFEIPKLYMRRNIAILKIVAIPTTNKVAPLLQFYKNLILLASKSFHKSTKPSIKPLN